MGATLKSSLRVCIIPKDGTIDSTVLTLVSSHGCLDIQREIHLEKAIPLPPVNVGMEPKTPGFGYPEEPES